MVGSLVFNCHNFAVVRFIKLKIVFRVCGILMVAYSQCSVFVGARVQGGETHVTVKSSLWPFPAVAYTFCLLVTCLHRLHINFFFVSGFIVMFLGVWLQRVKGVLWNVCDLLEIGHSFEMLQKIWPESFKKVNPQSSSIKQLKSSTVSYRQPRDGKALIINVTLLSARIWPITRWLIYVYCWKKKLYSYESL